MAVSDSTSLEGLRKVYESLMTLERVVLSVGALARDVEDDAGLDSVKLSALFEGLGRLGKTAVDEGIEALTRFRGIVP